MSESGYILTNANVVASSRLDVLAGIFDPWTRTHLDARGLSAGWRVWEVGVGGSNTVRWLAESVGPTGHVLATDLDPRWAAAAVGPNVSVMAHDVTGAPPERGFDLIHARLVLTHVREREQALRNLADALRPGGWLVIEDPDPDLLPQSGLDGPEEARDRANRLSSVVSFSPREAWRVARLGTAAPGAAARPGARRDRSRSVLPRRPPVLERALTYDQVGKGLGSAGLATEAEIARHVDNVERGLVTPLMAPLFTVWGRKGDVGRA